MSVLELLFSLPIFQVLGALIHFIWQGTLGLCFSELCQLAWKDREPRCAMD